MCQRILLILNQAARCTSTHVTVFVTHSVLAEIWRAVQCGVFSPTVRSIEGRSCKGPPIGQLSTLRAEGMRVHLLDVAMGPYFVCVQWCCMVLVSQLVA